MNLRQETEQTNSAESNVATKQGQAWYLRPEIMPSESAEAPFSIPELQRAPSPALFEPSAAERILARAGALQEIHGQLLSSEQIEVIAAEIGIKPEFVHLAIEQEKPGALLKQYEIVKPLASDSAKSNIRKLLAIAAITLPAYTISASLLCVTAHQYDHGSIVFFLYAVVVPVLNSLGLGIVGQNRRWGMASGAAFGTIYTVVMIIGSIIYGEGKPAISELPFFAIMIGSGALLGLIGAQARWIMSRRQASNQSRRTITHKSEQGA